MEAVPRILADSSKKFSGLVKKPERFLHQDEDLLESSKLLTKVVYDVSKLIEAEPCSKTLPELIIDGFDCEQVWAGVEMQNQQRLATFQTAFARLELAGLAECPLLLGEVKSGQSLAVVEPEVEIGLEEDEELEGEVEPDSPEAENSGASDDGGEVEEVVKWDEDILNDPDFQNMSDSDGDDLPLFGDLSEDEQDDADDEKGTFKERERKGGGGRVTEVDDQFFKLSDMEKFLDTEDKKEMGEKVEDENGLDLFEEDADDDDQQVMYKEYFDEGDDKDEREDESDSDEEDDGADDEDEADDSDEESAEAKDTKPSVKLLPSDDDEPDGELVRSSHEAEQERLARRVGRLEEAAVGAKPWQLGGEVAAGTRQENSLLAEHLDYDTAVRHAPVVTEDVARKLEDIIRQRVKDRAWDSVERKVRPVEDPLEYKKKLVLDQEKSKLSLAQVYEEEYVRLAEGAEAAKTKTSVGLLDKEQEETPAEVQQIKQAMHGLFRKLDSLTHLHYTPKQKSAELKIVRNLPTIAMEEVAPIAASNATLLAPAEVVDKAKGELMDDAEKTETDKKRERREKKAKKSAVRKNRERREAQVEKMNPGLGNKYSKKKALKKIEEAEKQGKVSTIKGSKDKSVKSSTAFFSSLQDEVKTGAKEKSHAKKKKKALKDINVASLKL